MTVWHDPRVQGAIHGAFTGWVASASVDLHTWASYRSWRDFRSFDFNTASFRWMIGIVGGALSGAGFSQAAALFGWV